jgi:phosphate/sulfate permease
MHNFYLFIVIVLFILAISDLVVGVANDAVNFLNSSIGAKIAPFFVIMIIASLGVFVGSSFSGGMMEVARKGIFHPEQFYFSEIILIFLAVMITDVLLLNVFNALGLPTSTTVSLVFELLGAAVAISIAKIAYNGETMLDLNKYINSSKALAIISSILISVFVGFIVGAIIQYIARLIFSFNYQRKMKYFGAIWGALSISIISYFIFLKGLEGASFISEESLSWVKENTSFLMIISIIGLTVFLQLLYWLFKINILTIIVLYGTFALAMAFASNDLVNFIGVPMAGFKSYQLFQASSGIAADAFSMNGLSGKVQTETYMLIIAGLIMVLTLWFSKKAKTVIRTTVDLSRQGSGEERFASSQLSRSLVRVTMQISDFINGFLPKPINSFISKQFKPYYPKSNEVVKDMPAFDSLRASVNLMVASTLIAFGTSLKLPLSTTYITFMVAMGTSLSDKAWGRESAVYRISGVFTVIGGWFVTALIAFIVSLIVAFIIYYGGVIAVICVLLFSLFLLYRTHVVYKKRESNRIEQENNIISVKNLTEIEVFDKCIENTTIILKEIPKIFTSTISGLADEKLKLLKSVNIKVNSLNNKTKLFKNNIPSIIENMHENYAESGLNYVQMLDYLREIAHSMSYITNPCFEHINNNHKGLISSQKEDLVALNTELKIFFDEIIDNIEKRKFNLTDDIINKQQLIIALIEQLRKKQIKRIKNNETGTKNSMLYLNFLVETKNILLYTVNLYKAERDFVNSIQR